MRTSIRYLLFASALLAALPLLLLVALLPSTPITALGAGYLLGCIVLIIGLLAGPWWRRRADLLAASGAILLLTLISLRLAFPPTGSQLTLVTLPQQSAPRWANRIFDEQDAVLFGAQIAPYTGYVSQQEDQALVDTLSQTYTQMHALGLTPLSPFVMTYLNQQRPEAFDALIAENPADGSARSGIIFLHGYGGNFTLQCWLLAQAGSQLDAITVCPSTGHYGDWWSPNGVAILEETISYLKQRGVQRIYLAGLSNGGIATSRLAQRFEGDLAGLILISGADATAPISNLPVLVIQGDQDERMPTAWVEQYVAKAEPHSTYQLFEGDHFVLLKQASQVQQAVIDWLRAQEMLSETP